MKRFVLISLMLLKIAFGQSLLYFKDSYKTMYLPNSYRFAGSGFIQYGLYNETQFDDLVNNQNYIPIASVSELDNLRLAVNQIMGVGTKYEGLYMTGEDKKYVMYQPLDIASISNWSSYGAWSGIFDGNEVDIINFYQNNAGGNAGFFSSVTGIINNIRLFGQLDANTSGNAKAGLCGTSSGGTFNNCQFSGTVNVSGSFNGGLIGDATTVTVTNCYVDVTINNSSHSIGGIIGRGTNITIEKCVANVTINSQSFRIGGIIGNMIGASSVAESYSYGNIEQTVTSFDIGGAIGICQSGAINNSYSLVNITGLSSSDLGGFAGQLNSGATIDNCYSYGSVTSTGSNIGGLCGNNLGTITASYYDTNTSGQSDTGKGAPKTTTEMQQGSIPDTTIYVGWSNLIWDAVNNTSYPELISLQ